SCDPRFATLRLRHAVQPAACLTLRRTLRRFLSGRLPPNRISDTLPTGVDAPQGDDLPLGLLTDVSFYHAWYFPRHADAVFRRNVLMDGLPLNSLENWKQHYRRLLQKLVWDSGRKRLVVRNACNTSRIAHVLSFLPDAKFVYCHRDPYEV